MDPERDAVKELSPKDRNFPELFLQKYCEGFRRVSPEFKQIKRITSECIMLQECSRRALNWPTLKVGKFVAQGNNYKFNNLLLNFEVPNLSLPEEVLNLLLINGSNLILAGGSIVDFLLGNKVHDYDLFCIGNRPLFRTENWMETSFSISTMSKPKIQLIKRIYDNAEQVIGGFDLDASRFYMDSNFDVYTTVGGLASLRYKINPINFNCYSASFFKRIRKYTKKGFNPIFLNKVTEYSDIEMDRRWYRKFTLWKQHIYFHDYDVKLSNNATLSTDEKVKLLNFSCLMRGEFDGFCVSNGNVLKKEEFIEYAKQLKEKDREMQDGPSRKGGRGLGGKGLGRGKGYYFRYYGLFKYYHRRNRLFPKTNIALCFADLKIPPDTEPNLIAEFIYQMRVKNIDRYYHEYTSIVDKFRISNPGSQHTSSFHPVQFKTLDEQRNFLKDIFRKRYLPHDNSSPDIIGWLLCSKSMKLPRPVVYYIASFVCAFKLIDRMDLKNLSISKNTQNERKRKPEASPEKY